MKLPHHRKYIHGIHRHFPLLIPKQCAACRHDFVRESMWTFIGGPWHGKMGVWYYLCRKCAPSKRDANEYASNHMHRRILDKVQGRDFVPPPPPPTKKNK